MKIRFHWLLTTLTAFSILACTSLSQKPHAPQVSYQPVCESKGIAYTRGSKQRSPAALACRYVHSESSVETSILANLPNDLGFKSTIEGLRRDLKEKGQLKSPVEVSDRIQAFREQFLPYLKSDLTTREAVLRFMEADLRLRSESTKAQIVQNRSIANSNVYDIVIVGSGVHGIIALNAVLAKNPNFKVLVIESSDTPAANFRLAGDTFNINSSNRPSGPNSLPLPGRGNINELPLLPVQVSDLSPVKYPSAGDLGGALVAGLYAAVLKHPNVSLAMRADAVSTGNIKGKLDIELNLNQPDRISGNVFVTANRMIVASGLGTPNVPASLKEKARTVPEIRALTQSKNIETTLPKVLNFEDVMRVLSQSKDPKKFFEGKKVAVVGTGDSANVFIEFLLGYSNRQAYGNSDGQAAGPNKIFWLGQTVQNCKDFIAQARSRYAQIGTGFRSSSPDTNAPVLAGVPSRVKDVDAVGDQVKVNFEDTSVIDAVDFVILTTGYQGNLRNVLGGYISPTKIAPANDKDFLDTYFRYLEDTTSTSGGAPTRIGRADPSDRVFIVGPSAGQLARPEELVGVIQNFVSIFNNAPRTVATSKLVGNLVTDVIGRAGQKPDLAPLPLVASAEPTSTMVIGFSPIRSIGTYTLPYITSVLKASLERVETPTVKDTVDSLEVSFVYRARNDEIYVSTKSGLDIDPWIISLTETRDFFNVLRDLLKYNPDVALKFEVPMVGGRPAVEQLKVSSEQDGNQRIDPTTQISNRGIILRGPEDFRR